MWQTILESVLITVITTAITTAAGFFIAWIKKKAAAQALDEESVLKTTLINTACDIIVNLVNATSQSVVSELKKTNSFTAEKASEICQTVAATAEAQLTEDMKKAIETTYNTTISEFIKTKIESTIAENK